MPAPSTTTASNINTELGKGSTTILRMGDANTRNLACKSSGTVSFGNCRWGINTPGRSVSHIYPSVGFDEPQYNITDLLSVDGSDIQSTYK